MIHGVPVEAWILSHRDALASGEMPPEDTGGLRVFLQCMELKREGPEKLTERQCQELAFRPLPQKARPGQSSVQ